MAVWGSSLSMATCPTCCPDSATCPCDTGAFPTNLTVSLTWLTGICTPISGSTIGISNTGSGSWEATGFGSGGCPPFQCFFSCIKVGAVYKFSITVVFSADLSATGYADVINCGPPVDIEFSSIPLTWSGFNGSTLCCDPGPDTGVATGLGTIKVKVTP